MDPLAEKYPGWSPYNYALNNPALFVDLFGDSAWAITHQWTDDEIKKYQDFSADYVAQYKDEIDCADLALSALVEFAAQDGLPVDLKYYDASGRTWESFSAASDEFTSKDQFLGRVKENLGALNIIDNTSPIDISKAAAGDLLMSKLSESIGHTRVINFIVYDKTISDYWVSFYKGTLPPHVPVKQEGAFRRIPNVFGGSPRRWRFDLWH